MQTGVYLQELLRPLFQNSPTRMKWQWLFLLSQEDIRVMHTALTPVSKLCRDIRLCACRRTFLNIALSSLVLPARAAWTDLLRVQLSGEFSVFSPEAMRRLHIGTSSFFPYQWYVLISFTCLLDPSSSWSELSFLLSFTLADKLCLCYRVVLCTLIPAFFLNLFCLRRLGSR